MAHPIGDLDVRDRRARAPLHFQLRARRQQLGWSQARVGQATGFDAAGVRRLERIGVDQSYASTVIRWATALGWRLALTPTGFPPLPSGGLDELLGTVAVDMPASAAASWQAMQVLAELARIRVACQVTQRELATLFGTTTQAVSMVEVGGAGTPLVGLQRHARGIARCAGLPGAYLAVNLREGTPLA